MKIPFNFVLDRLDVLEPLVRPMFGCHAIYIRGKLVLILRNRQQHAHDNGVWLATRHEHHASLKNIFPHMRNIRLLGKTSSWQNLPVCADDFEESVLEACDLIFKNDPRIGTLPKPKKQKTIRKR